MLRFFIVYGRPAIYVAGSSPETCWAWQRGADRFERDAEALSDISQSGGESVEVDAAELRLNIARMIDRHGSATAGEARRPRLHRGFRRAGGAASASDSPIKNDAARQAAADRGCAGPRRWRLPRPSARDATGYLVGSRLPAGFHAIGAGRGDHVAAA